MNINISKSLKTRGIVFTSILLGSFLIHNSITFFTGEVRQSNMPEEISTSININQDNLFITEPSSLVVKEVVPVVEILDEPVKYFSITTDNSGDFASATFQYVDQNGVLTEPIPVPEGEENMINISGIFHSDLISLSTYATKLQINDVEGHVEFFPIADNILTTPAMAQEGVATVSAATPSYNITNINGTGTADSYYTNKLFENMDLNIVTRREWGAADYDILGKWYFDTYRFVIHHTAGNPDGDPYEYMRVMQYYHGVTRGWRDIGYNYVIAPDGTIFEARAGGIGVRGAHAVPNSGTIGISVMGNYQNEQPPQAALDSLAKLIGKLGQLNDIEPDYYDTVVWHNLHDVQLNSGNSPTSCAGQYLINKVDDVTASAVSIYNNSTQLKDYKTEINNWVLSQPQQSHPTYGVSIDFSATDSLLRSYLDGTVHRQYVAHGSQSGLYRIRFDENLFGNVMREFKFVCPECEYKSEFVGVAY